MLKSYRNPTAIELGVISDENRVWDWLTKNYDTLFAVCWLIKAKYLCYYPWWKLVSALLKTNKIYLVSIASCNKVVRCKSAEGFLHKKGFLTPHTRQNKLRFQCFFTELCWSLVQTDAYWYFEEILISVGSFQPQILIPVKKH